MGSIIVILGVVVVSILFFFFMVMIFRRQEERQKAYSEAKEKLNNLEHLVVGLMNENEEMKERLEQLEDFFPQKIELSMEEIEKLKREDQK